MYLQHELQINILLRDSLQEETWLKYPGVPRNFSCIDVPWALDTFFAEIKCYFNCPHITLQALFKL